MANSSSSSFPAPSGSVNKHLLDLNSPDFDAEAYVRNLLREKSIDDLVAVEEDMVKNVRWLDAEMRELVYENYNKFLMATQAVRNMQDRLINMRKDVGSLRAKMSTIVASADHLNEKFASNCERLQKLTAEARRLQNTAADADEASSL